jgi:hypothetical protein
MFMDMREMSDGTPETHGGAISPKLSCMFMTEAYFFRIFPVFAKETPAKAFFKASTGTDPTSLNEPDILATSDVFLAGEKVFELAMENERVSRPGVLYGIEPNVSVDDELARNAAKSDVLNIRLYKVPVTTTLALLEPTAATDGAANDWAKAPEYVIYPLGTERVALSRKLTERLCDRSAVVEASVPGATVVRAPLNPPVILETNLA